MNAVKRSFIDEDWLLTWIGLFVLVYVFTIIVFLISCVVYPRSYGKATAASNESNTFRVMFFAFTFFTIGIISNFKRLKDETIGKLAAVYVL